MRVRATYLSTVALTTTIVFACSSTTQQDASHGGEDGNASIVFAISGADFTGNSVRICGSRLPPDPKYRCDWSLTPTVDAGEDAGTACPCFNFTADGNLLNDAGASAVVTGLCPSVDDPPADWSFQYQIFSAPDCAGTRLNDGTHNFTCYDSRDIATQDNPNESVEPLYPGPNTNHVLCNTDNASKQFDFGSCAYTTTPADTAVGNQRFDCGCTPVGAGTCVCGDGGVGAGNLEEGCLFDPTTCEITCPVPIPQNAGLPMASLSILMNGPSVLAYVSHGQWKGLDNPQELGVSVLSLEGTPITPERISTPNPVNSCASNSITGTTVCTTNDADVYLISGTTLTATLASAGEGTTIDGCTNTCGVVMDSVHNRAILGIATSATSLPDASILGGYQILDLNTPKLGAPIAIPSAPFSFSIGSGWSVDPIRNKILSASRFTPFGITDITNLGAPAFFYGDDVPSLQFIADSASMDVSTGIAVFPGAISMILADLSQATLTPGSPVGTWDTVKFRAEFMGQSWNFSIFSIIQGTHIGILTSELSNRIFAVQLPSEGGTGTPEPVDWVSCGIGDDEGSPQAGRVPFTVTAYKSPNTGHAMGVIGDENGHNLTLVDLTMMLDPANVPRTSDPHVCDAGILTPPVLRTISVVP